MSYQPLKFQDMPKICRLNKEVIVTEKLDGTNAQISIEAVPFHTIEHAAFDVTPDMLCISIQENGDHWILRAGSKNRFLTVANDNFGFAKWTLDNTQELMKLGPGIHRGEWWGVGIQRGYGLSERRFSLFNVSRWGMSVDSAGRRQPLVDGQDLAPACCHVVPLLGSGTGFEGVEQGLGLLAANGSQAAPGFMEPEGIVIFHTGSGATFKATIEDSGGKWKRLEVLEDEPVAGENL